jgi:hypothetical protein
MFIVRSSTYADKGKYVTTVEVDAERASVTQAEGMGSVLSLSDAENNVVAFFLDWDSCWRDNDASIISVARTAEDPDAAPDAVPAEGGVPRSPDRG